MAQVIVILVQSPGARSYTNFRIIILKCIDMTLVCHKGSLDINQKVGVLMMEEYRNPNSWPNCFAYREHVCLVFSVWMTPFLSLLDMRNIF